MRLVGTLLFALAACGGPSSDQAVGDDSGLAADARFVVPDLVGADLAGADLGSSDLAGADLAQSDLTRLRVHYPAGAHAVAIRGDALPLDWTTGASATALGGGVYEYAITIPAASTLAWKPLLDDATWARGPNYLAHRGETVDVYPHFYNQAGTVSKLFTSFHSTLLGNDRPIWVYLPPTYAENTTARFPVVYMHDGQNLFDSQPALGSGGWRVDHTLDTAAETGAIRELIVIGVENVSDARDYEYTPTYDSSELDGGGADLYLRLLVEELKPQVDGMLRTMPARATTGVAGSSLGGLVSAYAGVRQAGTFGLVAAMSPSTWWDELVIVDEVAAMGIVRPDRVYLDYGDPDDGGDETAFLVDAYLGLGYAEGTSLHLVVQPGGLHAESSWAMRLPGALAFLFGPR